MNSTPQGQVIRCPVCNESLIGNDLDLNVHVYLEHPEVNDNISKMLNGEPYKTAKELRAEGVRLSPARDRSPSESQQSKASLRATKGEG
jgi:hypothetical protein